MKTLSKQDILGAKDIKKELASVPEWGGHVFVKGLTGAERDEFEESIINRNGRDKSRNLKNLRARLCQKTMVDEGGALLFSLNDITALSQKSAAPLDRLFSLAQKLSGMSDGDVEELAGNSDSGLSDSSTSD